MPGKIDIHIFFFAFSHLNKQPFLVIHVVYCTMYCWPPCRYYNEWPWETRPWKRERERREEGKATSCGSWGSYDQICTSSCSSFTLTHTHLLFFSPQDESISTPTKTKRREGQTRKQTKKTKLQGERNAMDDQYAEAVRLYSFLIVRIVLGIRFAENPRRYLHSQSEVFCNKQTEP